MIIVFKGDATQEQMDHVAAKIEAAGLAVHTYTGKEKTVMGAIGDESKLTSTPLESLPGVESVMPILKPYKVVGREIHSADTVIDVSGNLIGGNAVQVIGGPCSVETEDQVMSTARSVRDGGARFLRGGAFKPRTSPYDFQGLGEEGLKYLRKASDETGLPFVSEIMDVRDIDLMVEYSDMIQVGARNMQNFMLLKEIGKTRKPVLLKRGLSATIKELLMSAEYIASNGNTDIIHCERGIRTFETATRNTLDISAVPVLKKETHLPVVIDPSHAGGKWELVAPLSKAAVAVGADGLIIEVHSDPENALCDGGQSLKPAKFKKLMEELKVVAEAVGRTIA